MKTHALTSLAITFLLAAGLGEAPSRAQTVILAGTNYTRDFDELASGLPNGWTVWTNATATGLAGPATLDATATPWLLGNSGVFYNMAATDNIDPGTGLPFNQDTAAATQVAATNRAPGILLRSTTDPGAAFVVQIQDTLGFTNFQVSVDLMIMRTNTRSGRWTVDYAVGATPISFTPLGTLGDLTIDGTNAINSDAFGKTNGSYALPGAVSDQGENLWIRVALLTATGPTGGRDTYGIDNFSLSWTVVPPSTNKPAIIVQPQPATNSASTTATFTVDAAGANPLHYQWRKNDSDLADGANIAGANASTLIVSSVVAADAGSYSVVITNNFGSVTSAVAELTVVDPVLLVQPASRTNVAGDTVQFATSPAGTLPLTYRWQFNGVPIPGASGVLADWGNQLFAFTNAQSADQGAYSVVISNRVGVVTSAVAHLTLLPTPAARLAQWTFNTDPPDGDVATGVTTPAVGAGTAATVAGAYGTFLAGSASDPAALDSDNSGWNIKGYPPQGTANKTTGVQFALSTAGYQDIFVTWEQQNNTRASRYVRVQYTVNGADFVDHNLIDLGGRQAEFALLSADLAAVPEINHNPSFGFRIVAEFESTAIGTTNENYVATDPTQTYGSTAGAIRYDSVNVFGNVLGTVAPIRITRIELVGNTVRIQFTAGAGDSAGNFTLRSSPTVDGTYDDVSSTISKLGPGLFQADRAASGSQQFYRLRR